MNKMLSFSKQCVNQNKLKDFMSQCNFECFDDNKDKYVFVTRSNGVAYTCYVVNEGSSFYLESNSLINGFSIKLVSEVIEMSSANYSSSNFSKLCSAFEEQLKKLNTF